ncbi:MAG: hypothetical protein IKI64_02415 [Clostridia bacterium]|nr:hypothetical protein [Clostridia bacterium]
MSRIFKTAASVLALLLVIAMALVGCGTQGGGETNSGAKTMGSVKKIIEAFDAKEYEEAYELFAEKELDAEQQASLVESLSERIDKAVSDYSNDEIALETAQQMLNAIQGFNLSKLKTKLATSTSELSSLSTSKTKYADGLIAFSKLDWVTAIDCFSKVVEKDCYYADAVQRSDEAVSKMLEDISSKIALQDYDTALSFAEQLRSLRPANTEVVAKITEINTAKAELELEMQRQEAMSAAQSSYDQGNYTEAFDALDSFISTHTGDQEAIDALKKLKDDYVNLIIPKADEAMQKQEYLRALDMLNNAVSVLPDQRFTSKLDELNAVKPTYLCELSCANSQCYEIAEAGKTYMSATGAEYSFDFGNLFMLSCRDNYSGKGFAKFFLNYNYSTLKFTLDIDEETAQDASGTFKIIGDGVVLKELKVSRQFAPMAIELDVSNVGWLEFEINDSTGWVWIPFMKCIISNAYFEK